MYQDPKKTKASSRIERLRSKHSVPSAKSQAKEALGGIPNKLKKSSSSFEDVGSGESADLYRLAMNEQRQSMVDAYASGEALPKEMTGEDAIASRPPGSGYDNVRSVRNNNPGNIRVGGAAWQGAVEGLPKDEEFVVFESPEMGVRAMARTLNTYKTKYNLDTIDKIIKRWAPSSENDTKKYIKVMAQKTGISPNKKIGFDINSEEMKSLISAMIEMEGGAEAADYFSADAISKGVSLAGFDEGV